MKVPKYQLVSYKARKIQCTTYFGLNSKSYYSRFASMCEQHSRAIVTKDSAAFPPKRLGDSRVRYVGT